MSGDPSALLRQTLERSRQAQAQGNARGALAMYKQALALATAAGLEDDAAEELSAMFHVLQADASIDERDAARPATRP
jgi:hypothetical protein